MDVSDLKFASLPLSLQEKLSVARRQETIAIHKDVYENLRKGGVALTDAGTNPYSLYYSRSGGASMSMQSLPRANAHDSLHVSQVSVRTPRLSDVRTLLTAANSRAGQGGCRTHRQRKHPGQERTISRAIHRDRPCVERRHRAVSRCRRLRVRVSSIQYKEPIVNLTDT